MNKNDLEKKLENYNPPKVTIDHSKNRLRRELLNSESFGNSNLFSRFQTKELVITSAFSFLVISYIFISIFNNKINQSKELLDLVSSNYAGIIASDKTSYYDSNLRLFGKNDEQIDLKVDKWINHKLNKYSIFLRDAKTDQILDKLIVKGEKIYRMKNPLLQALNTQHDTHMLIFELADDLINSTEFMSDSIHLQVDANIGDQVNSYHKNGLLVYNTQSKNENEVGQNQNDLNTMQISTQVNLDEYLTDNPIDLLNELQDCSNLTYTAEFYDELSGKTLSLLRIENSAFDTAGSGLTIRINDQKSLLDSLMSVDQYESLKVFSYFSMNIDDTFSFADSMLTDIPKTVKEVLVDNETGEIEGVNYQFVQLGKIENLSSLRFTQFTRHELNDELFDPVLHDLEYIGSTRKVKKAVIKKFSFDSTEIDIQ